ncbi:hypothetical protein ACIQ9P_21930 [Kitasatospora sp. NPDC094019]|uniref:hypothetical protein n=1 Tax=Kitasatospora sp. NPDC094019 TaxID=3364091 RepID=UPI0037F155DC
MDDVATAAAGWARTVLAQLGLDGRCRIEATTVLQDGPAPAPPLASEVPYHSTLTIVFADAPENPENPDAPEDPALGEPQMSGTRVAVSTGGDRTEVHLPSGLAPAEALVLLADRLQDWAIELTHGAALPPCPGHRHPMRAAVIDGAARWCCPRPEGGGAPLPIA